MAIRFDLNLNSGNAAFEPATAATELARILRRLADTIENEFQGAFTLRDVNGNACGSAFLEIGDGEA